MVIQQLFHQMEPVGVVFLFWMVYLYIPDDFNPLHGLTFPRVDNVLCFIKMPRDYALSINAEVSVNDIVDTLEECERLKKTSLIRGQCKRIFGDYSQPVMYLSGSSGVKE